MTFGRAPFRIFPATVLSLALVSCSGSPSGSTVLTADMPLHLEDHLDAATVVGSEVPDDIPEPVEWLFDEPQPDWKPAYGAEFSQELVTLERTGDALRVVIEEEHVDSDGELCGYVYTDLPDWQLQDWAYVSLRARAQPGMEGVRLAFNFTEPARAGVWQANGRSSPLIADGTVQTYLLSPDPTNGTFDGPWRQLLFQFCAFQPSTLDLLSVTVIPKEAAFASAPVGVTTEAREGLYRRTLYTHAPATLTYQVRIPDAGQLDVGLQVVRRDAPVTFRVTVTPRGGEAETRLEETVADTEHWVQRRVDLSDLAGQTVSLALEAAANRAGSAALWAAPTLSGARTTENPNIIFYVIDGGGADYMSAYGYNRRTTPNLERLAAEGALFEYAYSNSDWTRPSTASFMTSLQHSVLGGFKNGFNVVPDNAPTLAQHMHWAGYQTAVFTSNPNAGRMSGLDRGVDLMREAGVERDFISSVEFHEGFWSWRDAYPSQPYWVHFQTTDVHEYETGQPEPVAPFSGLFVNAETRESYYEDWDLFWDFREDTGIDRVGFFETMRSLYDESMAHQDYQIGRLVERLKAAGEWGNTLLIIAADHSVKAALYDLGVLLQDSMPPRWSEPMFRPTISRVPLMFVWPGHIEGGQRFDQPVSMIDVLPTLLDLVGLPPAEIAQGQSLAPLLRGEDGWEPRPVILDIFRVDQETGELRGVIEVVDGRWGASLEINGGVSRNVRPEPRPVTLLLYDLWNDPMALWSVHEERPDLVQKYTAFLEEQFEAHLALSQFFTPSGEVELTPEQLRTLRSLGYIN